MSNETQDPRKLAQDALESYQNTEKRFREFASLPMSKLVPDLATALLEALDEVARLKAEIENDKHRPIGTGFIHHFNNANAAVGITQFMGNQPQEQVWCSCGEMYPKGEAHKHRGEV